MSRAKGDDVADYEFGWRDETEKAICVTDPRSGNPVWLPKSKIEYERGRRGLVKVTIP